MQKLPSLCQVRQFPLFPGISAPMAIMLILMGSAAAQALEEPPAINPFGTGQPQREDAIPGFVELSDGRIIAGKIFMTRDKRVKIYDQQIQRQREIPLDRIKEIECVVVSEKMEKEYRFRETAADVKEYTGRTYPTREYLHRVTLADGRTLEGPLSEVIYIQPEVTRPSSSAASQQADEPLRFILYKTHKGPPGTDLKSLVFVKRIALGEQAFQEATRRAQSSSAGRASQPPSRNPRNQSQTSHSTE